MSNVHYLPFPPAIRCIDPVSPVRARAEQLMRAISKHPQADAVPDHLFLALVDVLDAVVLRVERAEASNG